MTETVSDQSMRPAQAARFLGVGESTFWRWSKAPGFPQRIKLSERVTVYRLSDLQAWRDAQGAKAAQ